MYLIVSHSENAPMFKCHWTKQLMSLASLSLGVKSCNSGGKAFRQQLWVKNFHWVTKLFQVVLWEFKQQSRRIYFSHNGTMNGIYLNMEMTTDVLVH